LREHGAPELTMSSTYQRALEGYLRLLANHPRRLAAWSVATVLILSLGLPRLTVTNDMRAYFSDDNPQLIALLELENVYTRLDTVYFLVRPRNGDVYSERALELIAELTELGWQVPFSVRVDSIANYQHTRANGDEVIVAPLFDDPTELDASDLRSLRAIVESEPSLTPGTVAPEGRASGVNVFLSLPEGDRDANDTVIGWARRALEPYRSEYPDMEILISGTTATNVALGEAVQRDVTTLVALSYAVIVLGLALFLRHLTAVLATLAVVTLAIASSMGVYGWAGAELAAVTGFVPSMVMTIAVADSVHVLTTFYYERRAGGARLESVLEAMRGNAAPIFITSVTTIIGVLTLNFSDSPPYRDLGNMVAIGVASAYVLSMTVLPAMLILLPSGNPARGRTMQECMSRFAELVIANRRPLLVVMLIGVVVLTAQIPRNRLTEQWHQYFDQTFEVRNAFDAMSDTFGWLHVVRFDFDSKAAHGVHEPRYIEALDRFETWLRSQPEVSHVGTLSHVVKRLNRSMHGDASEWYRLPATRAEVAQYLLLYELSLPLGLGLEQTIDVERRSSQVIVYLQRTDSQTLIEFDRRARRWLDAHAPAIDTGEANGLDMVFAHINHRNIRSLLGGMAIALVIISVLLIVALRSYSLGLLSLITNLAPAGLAYGAWGLLDGQIDLSASVVMCMSLGIVVDDTVHFLSKYLRGRRERGLSASDGMRYAFNTVGIALVTTTTVLVSGFMILALSHFNPSVTTGSLLAITLGFALVVDLLLMPPLLIALDQRWQIEI
jgi:predicted RND superfamily exporter protein